MILFISPIELKEKFGIEWETFCEVTGRNPQSLKSGVFKDTDEFDAEDEALIKLGIIRIKGAQNEKDN